MIENTYSSIIDLYIDSGLLEEIYSEQDYSIYRFFNMLYIGFCSNMINNDNAIGIPLTSLEWSILNEEFNSELFYSIALENIDNSLVINFNNKLLKRCKSFLGKSYISAKLDKLGYEYKFSNILIRDFDNLLNDQKLSLLLHLRLLKLKLLKNRNVILNIKIIFIHLFVISMFLMLLLNDVFLRQCFLRFMCV